MGLMDLRGADGVGPPPGPLIFPSAVINMFTAIHGRFRVCSGGFMEMEISNQDHGIPVTEKPVAVFDRFLIGLAHKVQTILLSRAGKCRYEHQQGAFG